MCRERPYGRIRHKVKRLVLCAVKDSKGVKSTPYCESVPQCEESFYFLHSFHAPQKFYITYI